MFQLGCQFQSHNGSIKTREYYLNAGSLSHFNPTMVRLKLEIGTKIEGKFIHFNPTMVRLKPPKGVSSIKTYQISIPQWFD